MTLKDPDGVVMEMVPQPVYTALATLRYEVVDLLASIEQAYPEAGPHEDIFDPMHTVRRALVGILKKASDTSAAGPQ